MKTENEGATKSMGLGENLKQRRKALKLTLEDVAAEIGTSKQTVQRYESGQIANIPQEKIERLAAALGTTPAALVGWEESPDAEGKLFPIRVRRVPMLGKIACGTPIYAEEEYGTYLAVDEKLDVDFCLRACGDSMTGARINDGDLVLVKKQEAVDNGEIAAVVVEGEATLKRVYYYPEKQKLILTPENPRYEPLVYIGAELDRLQILGKAVAFQSRLH